MELYKILSPNRILMDVEVASKDELFDILLNKVMDQHFCSAYPLHTQERLKKALFEREEHRCTAIGEGIATPHARLKDFPETLVVMARLKTPLVWDEDHSNTPVNIICMVLVNREAPSATLRISAQLAKFFNSEVNRSLFRGASSGEDIIELFKKEHLDVDQPICAREIMRSPEVRITTDMPLRRAATIMMRHRLDAVAVLDENDNLKGELSCDTLFKSGLPDFFNRLKSVSFIREFDPFETYFAEESHSTAGDLMTDDYCAMPPDATILEIVFALGVQRYPKIWVVEDGKRIGVIDRIGLLRNVIL
ncbi:MAG: PTS sugar transporter subunit IIA [Opitutales bacterium]|nr:PTS sugar transporter subunit IIA [Opitutales bacterium]